MKIKKYKCNCQYALYPFGSGCPVCIRDRMVNKDHTLPLKICVEKGCNHKEELFKSHDTEIGPKKKGK